MREHQKHGFFIKNSNQIDLNLCQCKRVHNIFFSTGTRDFLWCFLSVTIIVTLPITVAAKLSSSMNQASPTIKISKNKLTCTTASLRFYWKLICSCFCRNLKRLMKLTLDWIVISCIGLDCDWPLDYESLTSKLARKWIPSGNVMRQLEWRINFFNFMHLITKKEKQSHSK